MTKAWVEFLQNQEKVYEQIGALGPEVSTTGIRPEKNWAARRGAFSIALIHPGEVAQEMSSLSQQIASVAPAVVYQPSDIHTSLVSLHFEAPFVYKNNNDAHAQLLRTLCRVVQTSLGRRPPQVEITYKRPLLYTPEAVLMPGSPKESFGELQSALLHAAQEEGLPITASWGSHITLNRFTEVRPSHELSRLVRLLQRPVAAMDSISRKIAVGYSLWEPSPEAPNVTPEEVHGHFVAYLTFNLS